MGFSIKEAFGEQCAKESIAFAELSDPLIFGYKSLWAEMGDYLSL